MPKIRRPRVHQSAFEDPSAKEVGFVFLTSGTQRSDWGSARRSSPTMARNWARCVSSIPSRVTI